MRSKYGWAYEARSRFISQLNDISIQEEYHSGRGPQLVVYGPSQVGKTTLILLMLGIRGAEHERIAKALRGGASIGSSATASAVMYTLHDEETFTLSCGASMEQGLDVEMLSEHVKRLREEIVRNPALEGVVTLSIPRTWAISERRIHDGTRIIDLPGEGSRDARDREVTNVLLSRYVRSADLVLLVNRADQLVWFESIAREGLASYWPWLLNQYAVVVTHAMSDASVRDRVTLGCTFEEMMKYIRAQLSRSLESIDAPGIHPGCEKVQMFMIDYGQSRSAMLVSFQQLADAWLDQTMDGMIGFLNTAADRNSPLRRPLVMLTKAMLRYEHEKAMLRKMNDQADHDIKVVQEEQAKAARSHKAFAEHARIHEKRMEEVEQLWNNARRSVRKTSENPEEQKKSKKQRQIILESLYSYAEDVNASIVSFGNKCVRVPGVVVSQECHMHVEKTCRMSCRSISDMAQKAVEAIKAEKLSLFDNVMEWVGSPRDEAIQSLNDKMDDARRKLREKEMKTYLAIKEYVRTHHRKGADTCHRQMDRCEREMQSAEDAIVTLKDQHRRFIRESAKRMEDLERDIRHLQGYEHAMNAAFLAEVHRLDRIMRAESHEKEKVLEGAFEMVLVLDEYQSMQEWME